jgi:hypothetical protein
VPLGTYTGWNLRRKEFGADGMLTNLQGSFIPFAVRRGNESQAEPDGRDSVRVGQKETYGSRLDPVCERLVEGLYMLAEDRPRYAAYGAALWKFVVEK